MEEKATATTVEMYISCKCEETVARNCMSSSHCFEFSRLADHRKGFLLPRHFRFFSRTMPGFQEAIARAKSKKYI